MNTKIGSALCALALFVPAWMLLRAEENLPAPTIGKVLVLDNERTLDGDVERFGEQYRVRRALGELWIQRENVLRVCKDYAAAYRFLLTRANLLDPDEHLRLAKWCQKHGLPTEALMEVSKADELRPGHAETQRLLRNLRGAAVLARTGKTGRAQQETETMPAPPPVTTESLSVYVTRVQPLLMNACANCHATGRGGALKLTRVYENGMTSRRTTLQNLSAVLAKINPDQVQASPLLIKALSVHGDMAQPALKGREVAAYRILEEWVSTTVATCPQLHEQSGQTAAGLVAAPRPVVSEVSSTNQTEFAAGSVDKPEPGSKPGSQIKAPQAGGSKEAGKSTVAKPPVEPADPYDPSIFNRQVHPDKN